MYQIKINRERCKGCGNCEKACPENWKVWDDHKAHVIKYKIYILGCNKKAMESCPYNAISIVEI